MNPPTFLANFILYFDLWSHYILHHKIFRGSQWAVTGVERSPGRAAPVQYSMSSVGELAKKGSFPFSTTRMSFWTSQLRFNSGLAQKVQRSGTVSLRYSCSFKMCTEAWTPSTTTWWFSVRGWRTSPKNVETPANQIVRLQKKKYTSVKNKPSSQTHAGI